MCAHSCEMPIESTLHRSSLANTQPSIRSTDAVSSSHLPHMWFKNNTAPSFYFLILFFLNTAKRFLLHIILILVSIISFNFCWGSVVNLNFHYCEFQIPHLQLQKQFAYQRNFPSPSLCFLTFSCSLGVLIPWQRVHWSWKNSQPFDKV